MTGTFFLKKKAEAVSFIKGERGLQKVNQTAAATTKEK
jgi:hypothetical protein